MYASQKRGGNSESLKSCVAQNGRPLRWRQFSSRQSLFLKDLLDKNNRHVCNNDASAARCTSRSVQPLWLKCRTLSLLAWLIYIHCGNITVHSFLVGNLPNMATLATIATYRLNNPTSYILLLLAWQRLKFVLSSNCCLFNCCLCDYHMRSFISMLN